MSSRVSNSGLFVRCGDRLLGVGLWWHSRCATQASPAMCFYHNPHRLPKAWCCVDKGVRAALCRVRRASQGTGAMTHTQTEG